MLDGYERNIDYARISLTDKCNLRCVYCMPEDKVYENNLINDTLSFNDYKFIINGLSQVGIKKIKFTGGEPLLYPHLIELIKYAHYECNIDDISITTNGIGLNEILAQGHRLLRGVDGALDGWKSQHVSGKAQAVLRSAAGTGEFPVVGAVPTVARNFLVGLALLKLRIVKRKFLIEHQNILRLF